MLSPSEKLAELRMLRKAIASERIYCLRVVNQKGFRKRRVRDAIACIRRLRKVIADTVRELLWLRGATNGMIFEQIDKYDSRLKELGGQIAHLENRVKIDRFKALSAQIEANDKNLSELTRDYAGARAVDSEELIESDDIETLDQIANKYA